MKILITGGDGYIGNSLYNALKKDFVVIKISRKDFDLSNSFETLKYFSKYKFDVVLHCAASGGSRLKSDGFQSMDNNLKMYYNLLNCKNSFNKLIHFGSGAEIYQPESPYGLSKKVISNSISEIDRFYNLRIFAVFDENELETRFIKTNIKKYINHQHIEIFEDKKMDFFYMDDLVTLVKYYISNDNLPKDINCNYNYVLKLSEISSLINNLDSHKVDIIFNSKQLVTDYKGEFTNLGLNFIGLKQGIINTYNKLKNEY
jgi:GDP-L-fucose synthase